MTKHVQMLFAMMLALVMAAVGAFISRTSKAAKVQPSVEKNSCRAIIQKALALGWEDSHHDLAKALVIGRERLPEAQRAYERSCEAEVKGVRLNVGRRGFGVTVGGRLARFGLTSRGQFYQSASIPGTGISMRRTLGSVRQLSPGSSSGRASLITPVMIGIVVLVVALVLAALSASK